ncbi:hypothetical protein ACQPZ2_29640 [Nocardia pseudovaccinii]|uniref:hypothetical protein n=1 Tax=Nocardia pseudovaccinii TaxID=189540 RepID=UPI003D8EA375
MTASNQLAALLDAQGPAAKAILANIESAMALAVLTRYPTAASAASLIEKRIAAFCAERGYSGKKPATVLARLRLAPTGTSATPLSPTACATQC